MIGMLWIIIGLLVLFLTLRGLVTLVVVIWAATGRALGLIWAGVLWAAGGKLQQPQPQPQQPMDSWRVLMGAQAADFDAADVYRTSDGGPEPAWMKVAGETIEG
jgi:hypothetical protein